MTIDQRNTIGTAWSGEFSRMKRGARWQWSECHSPAASLYFDTAVGEPYTLTIAPHFDTVIAATCFLMYHYIVLQYKVGVV